LDEGGGGDDQKSFTRVEPNHNVLTFEDHRRSIILDLDDSSLVITPVTVERGSTPIANFPLKEELKG
jgi:hypothetical protein